MKGVLSGGTNVSAEPASDAHRVHPRRNRRSAAGLRAGLTLFEMQEALPRPRSMISVYDKDWPDLTTEHFNEALH